MLAITELNNSVITSKPCTMPTDSKRIRKLMNSHFSDGRLNNLNSNRCGQDVRLFSNRQKDFKNFDRPYTKGAYSPVELPYVVRALLWGDSCIDVDQSCSHQRILLSALKADGVDTDDQYPRLTSYVQNKKHIRQEVAEKYLHGDICKAKQVLNAITFGGSPKAQLNKHEADIKHLDDEFLTGFEVEVKLIANAVVEANPKIATLVQKVIGKRNEKDIKAYKKANPQATDEDARKAGRGFLSLNRSMLALFCRNKEQLVSEAVIQFLVEKGVIQYRRFAPSHDGVMLYRPDVEGYLEENEMQLTDLLQQVDAHVLQETKLECVYEEKDMQQDHVQCWADFECYTPTHPTDALATFDREYFLDLQTPKEQKEYWELHFAWCIEQTKCAQLLGNRVQDSDGTMRVERTLKFFSKGEMIDNYSNLPLAVLPLDDDASEEEKENAKKQKPVPFVAWWFKQSSRRSYNKMDSIPYAGTYEPVWGSTKDVLNTFVGYPEQVWDENDPEFLQNPQAIADTLEPFFNLICHLIGCKSYDEDGNFEFPLTDPSDVQKFDHLTHLIGHHVMCSEKDRLPYAVLIKSIQGVGKNTLGDVISRLIGEQHYICSSNIEDFYGTYAEGFYGKLFAIFNEAEIGKTGKHKNQIKETISEHKSTANQKFIRPFEYALRAMVLVFSNEEVPVNLDTTGKDRRWVVFESNTLPASWNDTTWKRLHNHFQNPNFLRALRVYFANLDYDSYDYKEAKKYNSDQPAYKRLAHYFKSATMMFMQRVHRDTCVHKLRSKTTRLPSTKQPTGASRFRSTVKKCSSMHRATSSGSTTPLHRC